ncbi:MAG: LD-carboxypeptidase [Caulobacteraceae bacterium]|nr:LD-carboxypeptidase [Caulobacteraceae bacterium]
MSKRIGIVGTSSPLDPRVVEATEAMASRLYPEATPSFVFAPQCFETAGHFAGPDGVRAQAFVDMANDPEIDAVWFGRGGYGSGRLIETVMPLLGPPAREKDYLGYSDAGAMLAALYGAGFTRVAHGPMPHDALGYGAPESAERGLRWLMEHDPAALEPSVDGVTPTAAFNIMMLSSLIGTPWQPDLAGHVVMLEEVSEYLYRIDRALFHITSNPALRRVKGFRLGRWSITPNPTADFAQSPESVLRHWCERAGVDYLGEADIGHDLGNRVVPFGLYGR